MALAFGELTGKHEYREIIKSPVISVTTGFKLNLIHNDVPVHLYYKHKNNAWQTLLINNGFTTEAVPYHSDIYLSAALNTKERVVFSIEH